MAVFTSSGEDGSALIVYMYIIITQACPLTALASLCTEPPLHEWRDSPFVVVVVHALLYSTGGAFWPTLQNRCWEKLPYDVNVSPGSIKVELERHCPNRCVV